jgi:geranylgeranyl reductase family protein
MTATEKYEVVVVGGGIAGCFAAATAAAAGAEVVQLERKSREQGGYIACGDAIKSPRDPTKYPGPLDMDAVADDERVLADGNIDQIEWRDEELGVRKVLPYGDTSNVIDRYAFGQRLLEETARCGADQHYDTVVADVVQEEGAVTGVEAVRDGDPVRYQTEVLVDAAGAQSLLQDMLSFKDATFEVPHYTHFGSAYREIIETDEPVEYANAIVGKPLEQMGYIWYFPRSPTVINAGLGFQMSQEPIALADRLAHDMRGRPEFDNARVAEKFGGKNRLGSSIALRRPLDSMVAPGYLAAGGAAATTHPISGKGIRGAALSGYSAGRQAAQAVHAGDTSEAELWGHNHFLYAEHGEGAELAVRDAYNVAAGSEGISVLRAVAALLPEDEIQRIVSTDSSLGGLADVASLGVGALKNLVAASRDGTFETLEVSREDLTSVFRGVLTTKRYVRRYTDIYDSYPVTRGQFEDWQDRRDAVDEAFYDALDLPSAERKY